LNKPLVIFLIGILFGIVIAGFESYWDVEHPEDSLRFIIFSMSYRGFFANVSYYIILIIILPLIVIPQLKKKMSPKVLDAYYFIAGITFWGAVDGLYIILN